MDDDRRNAFAVGFLLVLFAILMLSNVYENGVNSSDRSAIILILAFGGLGVGSILKPDTIGPVATWIVERAMKNYRSQEETSHGDKQSMKGSPGSGQAIAKDGAKINQTIYNVPPPTETSNRGKVCPECLGDGKMSCFMTYCHEGYVTPPGLEPGESDKKCGICKGKGVVLCENCEGEGRIEIPV